jgi:adenine-specific DNA-methyltransferase
VNRPPRHPDQLILLPVDGSDPFLQSTERVSRSATMTAQTRQKELGAFYTPRVLADFLVQWALPPGATTVVDPACGDGIFLAACRDRLAEIGAPNPGIVGIDTDAGAIAASRAALGGRASGIQLLHSDFFHLRDGRHSSRSKKATYLDAVVGNPPYVRYQLIDADVRERAIFRAGEAGVRLTQLTSLWAPFVVHAAKWLRPGGRMAFVLPAELLHAQYARPVREFLLKAFRNVTVITFEERVFPGALTEVVLLLADKGPPEASGIKVVSVQGLDDLPKVRDLDGRAIRRAAGIHDWSGLLAPAAAALLDEIATGERFATLGSIAEVDIGTVTGNNDFFTLTADELRDAALPRNVMVPVVCKARDIGGAIYTPADHAATVALGRKGVLLALSDQVSESSLSPTIRAYLARGRRLGVPSGYKCRVRRRWFSVPATGVPTAFLTYMSNEVPRLVLNQCGAWSTNTVHGVTGNSSALCWAAAVFINTATLVSVELAGRSYGGGVLKLEPTEAERILVATKRPSDGAVRKRLERADTLLRAGDLKQLRDENDALLWNGESQAPLKELRLLYSSLLGRRQRRGDKPAAAVEASPT